MNAEGEVMNNTCLAYFIVHHSSFRVLFSSLFPFLLRTAAC